MTTRVTLASQAELVLLRRVAERGLRRAQEREDSEFVDIFQHLLDELWYLIDDDEEDNTY